MRRRRVRNAMAFVLVGAAIGLTQTPEADGSAANPVIMPVIVMAEPGRLGSVLAEARRSGITPGEVLDIIDGFSADLTPRQVTAIRSLPGVTSVTDDRVAAPQGLLASPLDGSSYDPVTEAGSMFRTRQRIGADAYWNAGFYGQGVEVAVVDTGVARSPLLGRRLIAGPDVSGEGDALSDGFGHGTYIASLIAGRETASDFGNSQLFVGVAPKAKIVSVKVADRNGATSTSKIVAGLRWVLANGRLNGRNIRVVNLSFGAPPLGDYRDDPLARAVEKLWFAGYVVVASAGNGGRHNGVAAPAYDPYVVAVGAIDSKNTADLSDDDVAAFSSCNSSLRARRIDIAAPGRSIQGATSAGSMTEKEAEEIAKRFIKGTGTSQSAALVSGAAALVANQRPNKAPDSIKWALSQGTPVGSGDARCVGMGVLSLTTTFGFWKDRPQTWPRAWGGATAGSGIWNGSRWAGSRWAGSRWAEMAWMADWE